MISLFELLYAEERANERRLLNEKAKIDIAFDLARILFSINSLS